MVSGFRYFLAFRKTRHRESRSFLGLEDPVFRLPSETLNRRRTWFRDRNEGASFGAAHDVDQLVCFRIPARQRAARIYEKPESCIIKFSRARIEKQAEFPHTLDLRLASVR